MKVIVIGAGLIGVTTAYFLRRRGHDVTVVDRQAGPGRETSFANGGLLTPSMAEPWNAPGCWRVLLASLGRPDAPLQLRVGTLPKLARWGSSFLRNSRSEIFERNALTNVRLALHSLGVMKSLRQQIEIDYGGATRGSLRIFRDATSLERALVVAERRRSEGLEFQQLSREQIVAFEPALAPIAEQLTGAIHYPIDESGDAHRFCATLADRARHEGVEFRFDTEVSLLNAHSGQVSALLIGRERVCADQYVVAAGSHSAPLLRSVGVHLPVQPVKGYSVTLHDLQAEPALNVPVIDDLLHAVIVPLQDAIRVAGTAEFAGYDGRLPANRIDNLLRLLQAVLPRARFDAASGKAWCGLRPMSVDGVPIVGRTPISNLFINTGHGHLGWTLAAGSAQLLTELVCDASPSFDPAVVALSRFMN